RAGDDDPVVAGEHPGEALAVTLRQQLPQPPLPLPALLRLYYPVWFRLRRLRSDGCARSSILCGQNGCPVAGEQDSDGAAVNGLPAAPVRKFTVTTRPVSEPHT